MVIKSLTDIGSTRKENQDNYWCATLMVDNIETGIICMCDGMGGLDNGGLASKIVVESVREAIKEGTDFSQIPDVLKNANNTIHNLGSTGSTMGTTCTVVMCQDKNYNIYHVGDSRCYLLREGKLQQLTEDHSVLNAYGITREKDERLWRKYKNALTRCIGVKPEIRVDNYTGSYREGDVIFACSDGFWHYFEKEGKVDIVLGDLKSAIKTCIDLGETDNISIAVLQL